MKIFDMILKEEKTVIDNVVIGTKHKFTYSDGMVVERYFNDYEVIDNSKYEVREYYGISDDGELKYDVLKVKPTFEKAYEKAKHLIECVDDEEIINPSIPEKYREEYIRSILEKNKMVITIVHIPNTKKFEDLPDDVRFKRNRIEHLDWHKVNENDINKVYEVIKNYV